MNDMKNMTLDERLHAILIPYLPSKEVPLVTSLVKAAVSISIPDPIDVETKYEMGPEKGVYVSLHGDECDGEQLMYLSHFSEDQGWNHYHFHMSQLLKPTHIVVQ